ncbi:uncharacterized protein CTRU02_211793 [Colletotrichum truncatum]|uniref:Uncharacterized protein n=1 Tax=Colletotrichum truncatum TaxID=5467 RepID=A0ACC3YLQ1_COLTU
MMVIRPSTSGGEGIFCPVSTIYNELAANRPDLLCDLAEPDWPFDWPRARDGSLVRRPVMFLGERSAAAEMIFSRGALIRSHHGFRPGHVPPLTRRQGAALDALQLIAEEAAYRVQYETGDLVFFNNRRVLHGREAFRDEDDGLGKRHLLRLWLRDAELAGTPPFPLGRVWLDRFDETAIKGSDDTRWPLIPVED